MDDDETRDSAGPVSRSGRATLVKMSPLLLVDCWSALRQELWVDGVRDQISMLLMYTSDSVSSVVSDCNLVSPREWRRVCKLS